MKDHDEQAALVTALTKGVGESAVVVRENDLDELRRDKSPFEAMTPIVAVRVRSDHQVAAVLRVAREHGAPVVPRGNGFSLGGPPAPPGIRPIVLDMRSMDQVIDIDEESMTVTAECGVVMAELEEAVADRGFEIHTVAVPRRHTTLGGVLSGVCGGGFPLDTASVGGSGQFVTGLGVVLADGRILETNAGGSNVHRRSSSIAVSDGPQLTQLFIGDGGTLGVKVRATLTMTPARSESAAGGYEFDRYDDAVSAMRELQRVPDVPYANLYITRGPATWLMTFTTRASSTTLLDHHVGVVSRIAERYGGQPGGEQLQETARAIATKDPSWSEQFIDVDRGAVAVVFGNRDFAAGFPEVVRAIDAAVSERLAAFGIEPITFMTPYGRHAVWGAITLPYDPATAGAREAVADVTQQVYRRAVALGAWCEPHQGEISHVIAGAWSPEYRSVVESLRTGLDPCSVVNAGLWSGRPAH